MTQQCSKGFPKLLLFEFHCIFTPKVFPRGCRRPGIRSRQLCTVLSVHLRAEFQTHFGIKTVYVEDSAKKQWVREWSLINPSIFSSILTRLWQLITMAQYISELNSCGVLGSIQETVCPRMIIFSIQETIQCVREWSFINPWKVSSAISTCLLQVFSFQCVSSKQTNKEINKR